MTGLQWPTRMAWDFYFPRLGSLCGFYQSYSISQHYMELSRRPCSLAITLSHPQWRKKGHKVELQSMMVHSIESSASAEHFYLELAPNRFVWFVCWFCCLKNSLSPAQPLPYRLFYVTCQHSAFLPSSPTHLLPRFLKSVGAESGHGTPRPSLLT